MTKQLSAVAYKNASYKKSRTVKPLSPKDNMSRIDWSVGEKYHTFANHSCYETRPNRDRQQAIRAVSAKGKETLYGNGWGYQQV